MKRESGRMGGKEGRIYSKGGREGGREGLVSQADKVVVVYL
jgi:hypothetical protein